MNGDRHIVEFTRSLKKPEPVKPEWAQCKCGWSSGWHMTREATTLLVNAHLENVGRVRLSLSRHAAPGIADQYAYYMEKADDRNLSTKDRTLWRLLADELHGRVVGGDMEDVPLF